MTFTVGVANKYMYGDKTVANMVVNGELENSMSVV